MSAFQDKALRLADRACNKPASMGTEILTEETNRAYYPEFCAGVSERNELNHAVPMPLEYALGTAELCKNERNNSASCEDVLDRTSVLAKTLILPHALRDGKEPFSGNPLNRQDSNVLASLLDRAERHIAPQDRAVIAALQGTCHGAGGVYAKESAVGFQCDEIDATAKYLAVSHGAAKKKVPPRK